MVSCFLTFDFHLMTSNFLFVLFSLAALSSLPFTLAYAQSGWGPDVRLGMEGGQNSVLPQIAVSGNIVHVTWAEDDFGLLYRCSFDGGTSWQNIDSIVPEMGYSSIQAFGDTIYICGVVSSTGELRFTKSVDGANNWEPAINITVASANPTLKNISNNILEPVVSCRGFPNVEVYVVLSFNGGESWDVGGNMPGSGSPLSVVSFPNNSGVVYAGTGDGVYKSTNYGIN